MMTAILYIAALLLAAGIIVFFLLIQGWNNWLGRLCLAAAVALLIFLIWWPFRPLHTFKYTSTYTPSTRSATARAATAAATQDAESATVAASSEAAAGAATTEAASETAEAATPAATTTKRFYTPRTPAAPRLEDPLDYTNGEEYADNAYKYFEYMGSDDPWQDALDYWDSNGP